MRKSRTRPARAALQDVEGVLYLSAEAHPVELTAAAGGEGDSKLPTFSGVAYSGGLLVGAGGFGLPVVVDLEGLNVSKKSRPVLLRHNDREIVGHTTSIEVGKQIKVAGIVSGTGQAAQEVVANGKNQFPWQFSIGCRELKVAYVDQGEKVQVNGRTFTGPLYVCRQGTLSEISFCALGVDDNTSARVAASLSPPGPPPMKPTFAEWLVSLGFAKGESDLTAAQRPRFEQLYQDTIVAADPDPDEDEEDTDLDDPLAKLRAAHAGEIVRQAKIRKLFAAAGLDDSAELHAQAISEGWDEEKVELHILRAARPSGPGIHSRSHESDCTADALTGAMMLQGGLDFNRLDGTLLASREGRAIFAGSKAGRAPHWLRAGINDDAKQKVFELAHRFADISAVDLCREACRLDGKQAFGRAETLKAAFSGGSLGNMFNTNVNAAILSRYMIFGDSTRGWTQENLDVANFQPRDLIRMTRGRALKKLPRGKSAQHTAFADVAEQYRIARYAQQFVIDEQDAIDDRFGEIMATATAMMAEESAALRPDLVYAILAANAALADTVALFHASHNNLKTTSALSAANLKQAIAALELQTENSRSLTLTATHLIVPPTLKHPASELLQSTSIVLAGTAGSVTERGSANTINAIEQIVPVADPRLENGVVDPDSETAFGGSSSTWYLASRFGHTIEVGYLRGTGGAPRVRTWSYDKEGTYGLGADVNLDIGAKAKDFKGLVKSTA